MRKRMLGPALLAGSALTATALGAALPTRAEPEAQGAGTGAAVLVGAGDIASCDSAGDEATARLLDDVGGTVFTLGDNVYPSGRARDYADCYDGSWGRHRSRTRPAPGNHDYLTHGATGYLTYFGTRAAASPPASGAAAVGASASGASGAAPITGASGGTAAQRLSTSYYSYDLGTWHVVVLDSNCSEVGGCQAGSAQERWLRADLERSGRTCTLAYWHHPLFTSGSSHDPSDAVRPLFRALHDHGAELVLSGHVHNYERFAPQTPQGTRDDARGVRQFVVGTGGADVDGFGGTAANSQVRNSGTHGVLRLTLTDGGYAWRFLPVAGRSFTDTGSARCH